MTDKQFEQLMHRLNSIAGHLEMLVVNGLEQHTEIKGVLNDIYYKPVGDTD